MRLRPATPGDAPALAKIHVQSWRESYAGIISDEHLKNLSTEARLDMWNKYLAPDYPGQRFNLVAEDESRGVVGFASGGPQRDWDPASGRPNNDARVSEPRPAALAQLAEYEGELWAIYLLREFQGRGHGRELLEGIKEQLKADGKGSMLVWVLSQNPVKNFYARLGGVELGSKKIMIDREHDEVAFGWKKI